MNGISFISKYGFKPIGIVLVLAFISYIADFELLENIFIVLTLFLIYVYRDTSRHIFENHQSMLSPVDGTVLAVDTVDDTYKLYVKVNLCNNHNLRAPFDGDMNILSLKHGVNLNPNTPKGQLLNEQTTLEFVANDNGKTTLTMQLISGFFNPKIELKDTLEHTSQGEKIGFFVDGLAIIMTDKKPLVTMGDKLKASQTILSKID